MKFSGLLHPRELGARELEAFLSFLANTRRVAPSAHRQALCALVFLYKEVLGTDLPWLQRFGQPPARRRIPVVLSRHEVARLPAQTDGIGGLIGRLL